MKTLALGVDIAAATFTAALHEPTQGVDLGEFPNQPDGFEALRAALAPFMEGEVVVHLVAEVTGGYELPLLSFAFEEGWQVSTPNPKQLRDWAKGIGMRAKTDRQDARLLARFAAERQPPAQQPVPEAVQALDSLLKRRGDLEKMLREERNRAHALGYRPHAHAHARSSIERLIQLLEEELTELERQIKKHLAANPELAAQARALRSVPGVGAKGVLPLLVLLARWEALTAGKGTAKGLTAYVGLDPVPHDSGTSVRRVAHISRQGNRLMRRLLFMGALGGVRGRNPLRAFYQQLIGRGKAKKLALIAAARKILLWALAVFRSGQRFDRSRHANLSAPA